jgi:hypothetical protein
MVDALPSRTADFTALTYKGAHGDGRPSSIEDGALPDMSSRQTRMTLSTLSRDPAVSVTLSDQAKSMLANISDLEARGDAGEKRLQVAALDAKIAHFDRQKAMRAENADALAGVQGAYDKMRDTAPKPAVALNAEDTAAAYQMLKEAGKTLPAGPWDSYGFVEDGVQYNFKRDGSVTVQEESVATSAEHQAGILDSMSNMMSFLSGRLENAGDQLQSLREQRASLVAE